MAMDTLLYELKKLGLREKEVKIYLAGLELGLTSIKQLAERAGVTRPTAYQIVSALKKRGLFLETKEANRSGFAAQPPETLLGLLRMEERALAEREREFLRIIGVLESRYALNQNGGVRRYHGVDGMNALKERVITAPAKTISIIGSNHSKERAVWLRDLQKRMGNLNVRELSLASPAKKSKQTGIRYEWKKNPLAANPSEVWIMPDRVIVIAKNRAEGYLLENSVLISLVAAFFEALWNR